MKQVYTLAIMTVFLLWSCQSADPIEEASFTENSENLPFTESITITFDDPEDNFKAGDIVHKVEPGGCDGPVYIYARNPELPWWNAAMIFNSSNPSGGDLDLGTPNEAYNGPGKSTDGPQESNQEALGNILIITEDFRRRNPDDSYVDGSFYEINFSQYGDGHVTMESFLLIDVDEASLGEGTIVNLYGDENELLFTKQIEPGQDNEVRLIDLENTEGVKKMVLHLNNSGGIDNIKFRCYREEDKACQGLYATDEKGLCFLDDEGQEFSDWGWTNRIKEGYKGTLELWTAAEGCDITNGILVGELHVSYENCVLTARFEMLEGFYLTGTEFYAGKDKYPKDGNGVYSLAPEDFPLSKEVSFATDGKIMIDNLHGDLYLIARGSVCWDTKGG